MVQPAGWRAYGCAAVSAASLPLSVRQERGGDPIGGGVAEADPPGFSVFNRLEAVELVVGDLGGPKQ